LTSVTGANFFFVDSSQHILYGETLIPWPSEPVGNVPSASYIVSGAAALLPTRYLILTSNALTKFQYSRSIVSSSNAQVSSVVEVIDISSIYSSDDWDISKPFKGIYQGIDINYPNNIAVMNAGNEMQQILDFNLLDGYKRNVSELYGSNSALSVVLIFEIIF